MGQNKYFRIIWEKTEKNAARILRVYASEPVISLPETLENCFVTEIGNYCFAENYQLPENYLETVLCKQEEKTFADWKTAEKMCGQENPERLDMTTIAGSYLEEITLPETLEKIGNLAFYNCTSLKKITLGKAMEQVGSDAFMNCRKFRQITLNCGIQEKSGIRQILAQISSDMEVTFCGEKGIEAVVFYPEYYESYDEIAPAHLFGRNIEGEGFRARQCFKEGVPDLTQYDTIFPKACAEENDKTLRKLVVTRLRYPVGMNQQAEKLYKTYFSKHEKEIAEELTEKKKLEYLQYFCEQKLFLQGALEQAIQTAAGVEWAEGTAVLLHMKQEHFARGASDRYTFEEF